MLSNRLSLCADFVTGRGVVCDVGTDHAQLAAELVLKGKCSRVIASDIKQGPLSAAAKTVEKYNISDKVQLVLSDGLKDIPDNDDISDVVIAGMGGETIASILGECDWVKHGVNLVLQPMTKVPFLRKWLYDNGFQINSEKLAEDNGKLYTVINAEWRAVLKKLSEAQTIRGFFNCTDPLAERYYHIQSSRLEKLAEAMENTGKPYDAFHLKSISNIVKNDFQRVSVYDIYNYLDSLYPFNSQEKWDNSGLLVDNIYMECSSVLLSLDIDYRACFRAYCYGAELIISHHPVIFEPLKKLRCAEPVYYLVRNDIAAICMHTNLDKAAGGTNGVILRKLREQFDFEKEPEMFESCGDGYGFGYVCDLDREVDTEEFGRVLKEIFGCEVVRFNSNHNKNVKRFAFCSGSGGSMLELAAEKDCDAYITGDVKHDVWIDSNNKGITVFDCGHFHTENLVLEELRYVLEQKFPQIEFIIDDSPADPVSYIK